MGLKIKDIRNMKESQLNDKLVELKKEQLKMDAQVATGTNPQNAGQIRQNRRTMARIKTILNSKKAKEEKSNK